MRHRNRHLMKGTVWLAASQLFACVRHHVPEKEWACTHRSFGRVVRAAIIARRRSGRRRPPPPPDIDPFLCVGG
jgi:hypothetical protein